MTTISAKNDSVSISEHNYGIASMMLRYPLAIHAECKTHRVIELGSQSVVIEDDIAFMDEGQFSRNASSARAIPVKKLIADVETDPFVPMFWPKNQSGMQGGEELQGAERQAAIDNWMRGLEAALTTAKSFDDNVSKQMANRVLAPYAHINVFVTATSWANFLELRLHSDAEPHMQMLARAIQQELMNAGGVTKLLTAGQWHTPLVRRQDLRDLTEYGASRELDVWWLARRVSAARCARLSYMTFDGKISTVEKDLELGNKLITKPFHASPFEHQARPAASILTSNGRVWTKPQLHRNFIGWEQNRAVMEAEMAA